MGNCPLECGQGYSPPCPARFFVNFEVGQGQGADVAFHFNPRFDGWDKVVLNSKQNGSWGQEERKMSMPFRKGAAFELVFMVMTEHFKVRAVGAGPPRPAPPSLLFFLSSCLPACLPFFPYSFPPAVSFFFFPLSLSPPSSLFSFLFLLSCLLANSFSFNFFFILELFKYKFSHLFFLFPFLHRGDPSDMFRVYHLAPLCSCEIEICVSRFRRIQLFATPWTAARQAPLSLKFSRQEYWSGLPFSSGDLPDPGVEPRCPPFQADSLTSEPLGKPKHTQKEAPNCGKPSSPGPGLIAVNSRSVCSHLYLPLPLPYHLTANPRYHIISFINIFVLTPCQKAPYCLLPVSAFPRSWVPTLTLPLPSRWW